MLESTVTEQMYLVTIYRLMERKGIVRAVDIGDERGFSKSTVHAGLKRLENKGFINFKTGNITLTDTGLLIAKDIEDKHQLIYKALVLLGASEEVAEANACSIEHAMSEEVFELLRKHIAFGEQMANVINMKKEEFTKDLNK